MEEETTYVAAEDHVVGERLLELRRRVYSCMRDERAPMSPNVALALIDRCTALINALDKAEELGDLVCEAAQLAWAAQGDQVSAQAWEKRATEILQRLGEPLNLAGKIPQNTAPSMGKESKTMKKIIAGGVIDCVELTPDGRLAQVEIDYSRSNIDDGFSVRHVLIVTPEAADELASRFRKKVKITIEEDDSIDPCDFVGDIAAEESDS